ncbi:hypothetical protein M1D88_11380 [Arthrobacter sp. R1-13]
MSASVRRLGPASEPSVRATWGLCSSMGPTWTKTLWLAVIIADVVWLDLADSP